MNRAAILIIGRRRGRGRLWTVLFSPTRVKLMTAAHLELVRVQIWYRQRRRRRGRIVRGQLSHPARVLLLGISALIIVCVIHARVVRVVYSRS